MSEETGKTEARSSSSKFILIFPMKGEETGEEFKFIRTENGMKKETIGVYAQ